MEKQQQIKKSIRKNKIFNQKKKAHKAEHQQKFQHRERHYKMQIQK